MTQPDPEGQKDRRKLWVDKTAVVKPPPLGITMKRDGNDYDFTTPAEPEPIVRKRGPSPEKLDACKAWLAERLTPNPAPIVKPRDEATEAEYSAGLLYDAKRALKVEEYTFERRKWWRMPSVEESPEVDPPS